MELITGGSLYELVDTRGGQLDEDEGRFFFKEILNALSDMK